MKYQALEQHVNSDLPAPAPERKRPSLPQRRISNDSDLLEHDLSALQRLLHSRFPVSTLSEHSLRLIEDCIAGPEQQQIGVINLLIHKTEELCNACQPERPKAPVSPNHTGVISSQRTLRNRRNAGLVLPGSRHWQSAACGMNTEIFRELAFFADQPMTIEQRLMAQILATIALFSSFVSVRLHLLAVLSRFLKSANQSEYMQKISLEVLFHLSHDQSDRQLVTGSGRLLHQIADNGAHPCAALADAILSRRTIKLPAPRAKCSPRRRVSQRGRENTTLAAEIDPPSVREIVIAHNIREALGDEWIRNSLLISNLLRTFPHARISILTNRPYLYQHDRLTARPFRRFQSLKKQLESKTVDLCMLEYYRQGSQCEVTQSALRAGSRAARVTLLTPERVNFYHPLFAAVVRADSSLRTLPESRVHLNVYDTIAAHLAALGLSAPGAWNGEALFTRQSHYQPSLALLNPFGGTREEKGFIRSENHAVVSEILRLLDRCDRVAIIPNGSPWGDTRRLQAIASLLPRCLRQRVITSLPSCATAPYETIELIRSAERIVTVEGGLAHLAMASGKPVEVILARESGAPLTWLPRRTHREQTVRSLSGEYAGRK